MYLGSFYFYEIRLQARLLVCVQHWTKCVWQVWVIRERGVDLVAHSSAFHVRLVSLIS